MNTERPEDRVQRLVEEEIRRQEESEMRSSLVHQPRHVPVEVQTPIHPVQPYYPHPNYHPYPYPQQQSGPGWIGFVAVILFVTAPMAWMNYQSFVQLNMRFDEVRNANTELLKQGNEDRKLFLETQNSLMAQLHNGLQQLAAKNNELAQSIRNEGAANTNAAVERGERKLAEANAKNASIVSRREANRKASLVGRIKGSISTLKDYQSKQPWCWVDSACKQREEDLKRKIANAELLLKEAETLASDANLTEIAEVEKKADSLQLVKGGP